MVNEKKQFMNIAKTDKGIELDIFGDIGETWWEEESNDIKTVKKKLEELDAKSAESIVVNINSYGGDANHGLAIYEALKAYGDKVTTKCIGYCASAATIIAMAGTKRLMSEFGFFLIHKCSSYGYGNENDLEKTIESQRILNQKMIDLYVEATGIEKETIEELMEKNDGHGVWLTYEQCIEYGFMNGKTADAGDAQKVAKIDKEYFTKYGYPELPKAKDGERKMMAILKDIYNVLTHKNKIEMKNCNEQYPMLASVLEDVLVDEKGNCTMGAEALEKLEAKIKEMQESAEKSAQEKTEMENKMAEAEKNSKSEIEALNAKVVELSAIIEKTPAQTTHVNGDDPNQKDEFQTPAYMKEVHEILGK